MQNKIDANTSMKNNAMNKYSEKKSSKKAHEQLSKKHPDYFGEEAGKTM